MSTDEARGETVSVPPAAETPTGAGAETTASGAPTTEAGVPEPQGNLAQELRELGKQIQAILLTVRNDPRAREVEQQVSSAMRDAERQVAEALSTVRKDMESGKLQEKVRGTAAVTADQVESGLAHGLRGINQRMAKFVQDTEQARKQSEANISDNATSGAADNEVTDRFGKEEPVFGEGLNVPPAPRPPPAAEGGPTESLIAERFNDRPVDFGEKPGS